MVMLKTFKELTEEDVSRDPLVVLDCGHAFLMSTMDNHMEMEKYYEKTGEDENGIRWRQHDKVVGLNTLIHNVMGSLCNAARL